MGKLVYEGEGHIDFSWPGTTRDNATVESFNGSLQSAVCSLQSAVCSLQSAVCSLRQE